MKLTFQQKRILYIKLYIIILGCIMVHEEENVNLVFTTT